MGRRSTPPTTFDELFIRSRAVTARLFKAASYAHGYERDGELEAMYALACQNPIGEFDLHNASHLRFGTMIAADLEAFLQGGIVSFPGAQLRQFSTLSDETVRLRMAAQRTALLVLLHEQIHALGPRNPDVMVADWWSYFTAPHARVAAEGSTHLAAELFLDRFIRALNLEQIDSRIAEVTSSIVIYPRETTAMRTLCEAVATRSGRTLDDVVMTAVASGTAAAPLMGLVRALLGAQEAEELPRTLYYEVLRGSYRLIATALDHVDMVNHFSPPELITGLMTTAIDSVVALVDRTFERVEQQRAFEVRRSQMRRVAAPAAVAGFVVEKVVPVQLRTATVPPSPEGVG